jgi:hypothetical protein
MARIMVLIFFGSLVIAAAALADDEAVRVQPRFQVSPTLAEAMRDMRANRIEWVHSQFGMMPARPGQFMGLRVFNTSASTISARPYTMVAPGATGNLFDRLDAVYANEK